MSKLQDLLEHTYFYKGESECPEHLQDILYWEYEKVWVEWELAQSDDYIEDVRNFQRWFYRNKWTMRTDVPIGLLMIFASRLEHWTDEATEQSINNFANDYLEHAKELQKKEMN